MLALKIQHLHDQLMLSICTRHSSPLFSSHFCHKFGCYTVHRFELSSGDKNRKMTLVGPREIIIAPDSASTLLYRHLMISWAGVTAWLPQLSRGHCMTTTANIHPLVHYHCHCGYTVPLKGQFREIFYPRFHDSTPWAPYSYSKRF